MAGEEKKEESGGGATGSAGKQQRSSTVVVSNNVNNVNAPTMTVRARRRREEAVRRLVADVQSKAVTAGGGGSSSSGGSDAAAAAEAHDWIVASTVATALEKGLDRDLHAELVQEAKDNAGRIGQVCHDHADVFLASVAQVAALATPCADLADGLKDAQQELQQHTVEPMHEVALQWEEARQSHARARTVSIVVDACQGVAVQLERARKQAALGRPRAALDAVDRARTALTTPVETLFQGPDEVLWREALASEHKTALQAAADRSTLSLSLDPKTAAAAAPKLANLEQTPFGKRATIFLPKIEAEVLMSAKRGLNRWFASLRSGDAAKAGRAALRDTAHSAAAGPGSLGLGGTLPASFLWRAQMADNWISRTGGGSGASTGSKLSRACRQGYWFDRDAPRDADKLLQLTSSHHHHHTLVGEGSERFAEAIAVAFGWYRCWDDGSTLLIDPAEYAVSDSGAGGSNNPSMDGSSRSTSRHGGAGGLSGSRHGTGLSGSRHGLRGSSRHGGPSSKPRSLGFRASTSSRSQAFQEITSTLGTNAKSAAAAAAAHNNQTSLWAELLVPGILLSKCATRKEDEEMLRSLPESVHPVRRAEVAFGLVEKTEEFVAYYEQNRFGEMKIGGDGKDAMKSALSSLTGDDVSLGAVRTFFSKSLPHLCASVVGFSAVESALELSNFGDEEEIAVRGGGDALANEAAAAYTSGLKASRFRDSSERYERALVSELGTLVRDKSDRANLGEMVRMSRLLVAFRAALKLVHPSSTARRVDKELLALDADLLMSAIRIAQDEQLKATIAIVSDDQKIPMLVSEGLSSGKSGPKTSAGVPEPEDMGLPFGLSSMKQVPAKAEIEFQEQSRTSYNQAPIDEVFNFSHSVPVILRSLHARAITCAVFALSQQELGQKFPEKKGSAAGGYVLDCIEECVGAAVIGMKDSDNIAQEASVDKAVQIMANISSLQHALPRFFGTIIRGMFHVGLVKADEIDNTLLYAEKILKAADKSCDAQVGQTYSLVYEICRTKIDSHINYALENFNWVAKSARETPNPYCEGLIGYLKSVFSSLGPMDEGSRAGLHFSCCGHVSERLVKLLSGKPGDTSIMDDNTLPPLTKIDAYGLKNLLMDCEEFERFADTTGIPSLRDCFTELRVLTSVMLDKELPTLLLPDNAAARRRKYPLLSLEKVGNILEKYVGTGMFGTVASGRNIDILLIDKKEVNQLLKIVRSQR